MSQQQQRKGSSKPNLDGYVEVKDRVAQFLRDYPEGRIWSEWIGVQHAGDADWIVVKAYAARTPDDPRPATGIAWERVPGLTPYTKNSEAQNAETSAVGRAIAFVSERYAEKGIASADEVRNRQNEREPERSGGTDDPRRWPEPPAEDDPAIRWKQFAAELGEALKRHQVTAKGAGISVDQIYTAFNGGQSVEQVAKWVRDEYEKRNPPGPPPTVVAFRALMVTENIGVADVRAALDLSNDDDVDAAIAKCVAQHNGDVASAIATVRNLSEELKTPQEL